MPSYFTFDIPDDPDDPVDFSTEDAGSPLQDERVVDEVMSPQAYDANKMRKSEVDKLLDQFGIKKARGSGSSIDEKLEALASYFQERGDAISVKYKKDKTPTPKKTPSKTKMPKSRKGPEANQLKPNLIKVSFKETYDQEMGKGRYAERTERTFRRQEDVDAFLASLNDPNRSSLFEGRNPKIEDIVVDTGEPKPTAAKKPRKRQGPSSPKSDLKQRFDDLGAQANKLAAERDRLAAASTDESGNVINKKLARQAEKLDREIGKLDSELDQTANMMEAEPSVPKKSRKRSSPKQPVITESNKKPSPSDRKRLTELRDQATANAIQARKDGREDAVTQWNLVAIDYADELAALDKKNMARVIQEEASKKPRKSKRSTPKQPVITEPTKPEAPDLLTGIKAARKPRSYPREERRAIREAEVKNIIEEGDLDFPYGGSSSAPPGQPPRKPPTASGTPDPGDEEFRDDSVETNIPLEKLQAEQRKREMKEQDYAFQDLKRQQRREIQGTNADISRSIRTKRKAISTKASTALDALSDRERTTTSDRIVRRLAAFSIGRNLGSSGQLFAAGMEYGVFRPEEERTSKNLMESKKAIASERMSSLQSLEDELYRRVEAAEKVKQFSEDAIINAQRGLKGSSSVEDRAKILEELTNKLTPVTAQVVKPYGTLGSFYASQSSPAGRGNGGSGGGASPPGPPNFPFNLFPGGGGNRPPGPLTNAFNNPGNLTTALLGTAAVTDVARQINEAAKQQIAAISSVVNIDPLTQSGLAQAGTVAGNAVGSATRLGGAGAGAIIGSAAGPAGAYIGGALGFTAGTFVDPIVEAVKAGNSLLERFTANSMDFDTISVNASQEIATLLRKMEADTSVSEQTVEFSKARGDLTRSIIGLQEAIIAEFGDEIVKGVRALSQIVEFLSITMPLLADAIVQVLETIPGVNVLFKGMRVIIDILSAIRDGQNADIFNDVDLQKQIEEFFGTQNQFQVNTRNGVANRFGNGGFA